VIAHRLDSIPDFDLVVVLDAERVAEADKPDELKREEGKG
jgi:ABC-type multidrug transport system fused ATPase/permease subunit